MFLTRFNKSNIYIKKFQLQQILSALNYSTFHDINVKNEKVQKYLEFLKNEFYKLRIRGSERNENECNRMMQISNVVGTYEKRKCILKNMEHIKDLKDEKDEDMKQLVKEEVETYSKILSDLDKTIIKELLESTETAHFKTVIFEINAGVGGQEAMLFANELYEMYLNFIKLNNWDVEVLDADYTDIGGLRHATLIVRGENAYTLLENEAGVHRVQRVPATEKSGRTHTSTVSVSVVPKPDDINVSIDEKLLKIETKRASGAGGQHVNTTDSAVRITHLPTGVSVESQSDRSQLKNKEDALKKLKKILIQKEVSEQETAKRNTKKEQIGSSNRNEKIRTYNFTQDRITDHRLLSGTKFNLKEFLRGGYDLNNLVHELHLHNRKQKLHSLLENYNNMS